MKAPKMKTQARSITITAERLSDHSHITFSIASDKTIAHLRSLLNHHLPPYIANQFNLYSFQRGALIHFHPPSFRLDYFPVIFDQSVLLLQMDDRHVNYTAVYNNRCFDDERTKHKRTWLSRLLFSKTTRSNRWKQTSSSNITCVSILKQFFRQRSKSTTTNIDYQKAILTY